MSPNELKRRFGNASPDFIRANSDSHSSHATSKLERNPSHEPLEKKLLQKADSRPVLVRIVASRKRLIDEDNMCEKFLVDCLRYSGAIPDDSPQDVHIVTTQRKCKTNEAEGVEVFIEPLDSKLGMSGKL